MIYLLVKFSVIFLLVGIVSFLFGRWWARRHIVDVTDSYMALAKFGHLADASQWDSVISRIELCEQRLASDIHSSITTISEPQISTVDLTDVERRLLGISRQIEGVALAELAPLKQSVSQIKDTLRDLPGHNVLDIDPVLQRMDQLDRRLESTIQSLPANDADASLGLMLLNDRVSELLNLVNAIELPEGLSRAESESMHSNIQHILELLQAVPEKPDFSSLLVKLSDLGTTLDSIEERDRLMAQSIDQRFDQAENLLEAIPTSPGLQSIFEKICVLQDSVEHICIPNLLSPVDWEPVNAKLKEIKVAIGEANHLDECADESVFSHLDSLRHDVNQLLSSHIDVDDNLSKEVDAGPRLLNAPDFGEKDDLKQISGVGEKLEQLLNANGVYYFWQIAAWSPRDIQIIDNKLDVFRGRIERDNWVEQAKQFSRDAVALEIE